MRKPFLATILFSLVTAACSGVDSDPPESGGSGQTGGSPSGEGGQLGVGGSPGASPTLPEPTGACPTFANGDVTLQPAGLPPRQVKISMGDAGPSSSLIIYWHATGSAPAEATYALGSTLSEITAAGGIVAAPYSDPAAGQFEWYIVNQSPKLDDLVLADELVGCLQQAGLIDPMRIHSMGMSAGALQTTAYSFRGSRYLASVATYSGGLPSGFSVPDADPANKFAALLFFGGPSDTYGPLDFKAATSAYYDELHGAGRFAATCDHGGGHTIPLDAAPSAAKFFADHPYGTSPSPYAKGLPTSFPTYCSL